MIHQEVKLSPQFKSQTIKAIISISFFALTYFILLILAIGLTAFSLYAGLLIIISVPRLITILIGLGLGSLGILVLIFLLKFIFKSHKIDRSHLLEINKNEEPELFIFIEEIVNTVGTDFPKKIYLSADVNAGVFYDSSFFSMFFPIKKNLQIGLGLINTITKDELNAILAHEFGHFSQKTMKVGSYVYNVNQVIFNMLFDNESYDKIVQKWASINGVISIFVIIAVRIIEGIQWVLRKLYETVNTAYMGLSREMEFHADEIASHVTGYLPLKNSLLRMNLADNSFNSVLAFYESKISDNKKSINIYPEQSFIMNFIAKDNSIPLKNNFPEVTIAELHKFNKSKLVIKDQWASHPSTEERIDRLIKNNVIRDLNNQIPANDILNKIEYYQKKLTEKLFANIEYKGQVELIEFSEFKNTFIQESSDNSFSKFYRGYYDLKNPLPFDIYNTDSNIQKHEPQELFSDHIINSIYIAISLENDIEILKQIANKTFQIKSFDYDGKKYSQKESWKLIKDLETELVQLKEEIKSNDMKIFEYFKNLEHASSSNNLDIMYTQFFEFDVLFDKKHKIYTQLSEELQFIQFTIPIEQIEKNFREIKPLEKKLKEEIQKLLIDERYQSEITNDMRDNFKLYLSKDWFYFGHQIYIDKNLEMLFTILNDYVFLLSRSYFILKKQLLTYQEKLVSD